MSTVPPPEASWTAVRVRWGEPEPAAIGADSVQEAVNPAGLQSNSRSHSHNQGWQRKPHTQRPGPSLHCQPLRQTGLCVLLECTKCSYVFRCVRGGQYNMKSVTTNCHCSRPLKGWKSLGNGFGNPSYYSTDYWKLWMLIPTVMPQ